jgi:hypothetical protein
MGGDGVVRLYKHVTAVETQLIWAVVIWAGQHHMVPCAGPCHPPLLSWSCAWCNAGGGDSTVGRTGKARSRDEFHA